MKEFWFRWEILSCTCTHKIHNNDNQSTIYIRDFTWRNRFVGPLHPQKTPTKLLPQYIIGSTKHWIATWRTESTCIQYGSASLLQANQWSSRSKRLGFFSTAYQSRAFPTVMLSKRPPTANIVKSNYNHVPIQVFHWSLKQLILSPTAVFVHLAENCILS